MTGMAGGQDLVGVGGQPPAATADPAPDMTVHDAGGLSAPHPRREPLDSELRSVQHDVTRMASLVAEAIERAVTCLETADALEASRVIADDRRVNEMHALVQAGIVNAIATQQPVARDLRYLLAIDHVSYELERIGDYAASVAKQARKLAPAGPGLEGQKLATMGTTAAALVRDVIQALVDVDVDRAKATAARDDEIDALYHESFDAILDDMRGDPGAVDRGARLLFAAHYLERIGDRVTNIAEDVVYLSEGTIEDLNL